MNKNCNETCADVQFAHKLAIVAVNMPSMKVLFRSTNGGASSDARGGYLPSRGSGGYKLSSMAGKSMSSRAGPPRQSM